MKTNKLSNAEAGTDRMLSDFFKSELPEPFPAFRAPAAVLNAPTPVREEVSLRPMFQSRFALAASVALLLGGCWYLTGKVGEPGGKFNTGKGDLNAKIPKELLKAKTGNGTVP